MASTESSTTSSSQGSSTLVIRTHSLGDVVLAQPAVAALADKGPVSFVTYRKYLPVAERMPGDIRITTCVEGSGAGGLRRLLRDLDVNGIVDLQNNFTTRLATLGMPVIGRYGTDRRRRRGILEGLCESMPLRYEEYAEAAGVVPKAPPRLVCGERDCGRLKVGIVAGGRWRLKTIPGGVVAEAARLLADLHGAEVLITGGPGDEETVENTVRMISRRGIDSYAGQTGILGLIRKLEDLSLLIAPDSGPAHLAAALGIPVLVVFTSTSPELGFWDPARDGYYTSGPLECRPCHKHGGTSCMREDEKCRHSILPYDLVERGMELVGP
jgi:ADP-heptose:LPS heptosyltransferase